MSKTINDFITQLGNNINNTYTGKDATKNIEITTGAGLGGIALIVALIYLIKKYPRTVDYLRFKYKDTRTFLDGLDARISELKKQQKFRSQNIRVDGSESHSLFEEQPLLQDTDYFNDDELNALINIRNEFNKNYRTIREFSPNLIATLQKITTTEELKSYEKVNIETLVEAFRKINILQNITLEKFPDTTERELENTFIDTLNRLEDDLKYSYLEFISSISNSDEINYYSDLYLKSNQLPEAQRLQFVENMKKIQQLNDELPNTIKINLTKPEDLEEFLEKYKKMQELNELLPDIYKVDKEALVNSILKDSKNIMSLENLDMRIMNLRDDRTGLKDFLEYVKTNYQDIPVYSEFGEQIDKESQMFEKVGMILSGGIEPELDWDEYIKNLKLILSLESDSNKIFGKPNNLFTLLEKMIPDSKGLTGKILMTRSIELPVNSAYYSINTVIDKNKDNEEYLKSKALIDKEDVENYTLENLKKAETERLSQSYLDSKYFDRMKTLLLTDDSIKIQQDIQSEYTFDIEQTIEDLFTNLKSLSSKYIIYTQSLLTTLFDSPDLGNRTIYNTNQLKLLNNGHIFHETGRDTTGFIDEKGITRTGVKIDMLHDLFNFRLKNIIPTFIVSQLEESEQERTQLIDSIGAYVNDNFLELNEKLSNRFFEGLSSKEKSAFLMFMEARLQYDIKNIEGYLSSNQADQNMKTKLEQAYQISTDIKDMIQNDVNLTEPLKRFDIGEGDNTFDQILEQVQRTYEITSLPSLEKASFDAFDRNLKGLVLSDNFIPKTEEENSIKTRLTENPESSLNEEEKEILKSKLKIGVSTEFSNKYDNVQNRGESLSDIINQEYLTKAEADEIGGAEEYKSQPSKQELQGVFSDIEKV